MPENNAATRKDGLPRFAVQRVVRARDQRDGAIEALIRRCYEDARRTADALRARTR
jgi:hypothetical protein